MIKQGRWIKERKKIAKYPKTEQQIKIAEAGKEIGEKCEGREGEEFQSCRCQILAKYFKKVVCPLEK